MKLSNRNLLWLNTLTFVAMLLVNSAGAIGWLGSVPTVAEVSATYNNLLTPAGYAFSIWGLIYIVLAVYLAYQWQSHLQGNDTESLEPSGIWFTLSNLCNALWVIAWVNNEIGLSLIFITGLFLCLFKLVLQLRLEIWDAPVHIIFFVWWPIVIYTGWITLALPLNVAVLLKSAFLVLPAFSGATWAILGLATITTAYLLWTRYRNMREASLVGAWGFIAVAVNQWSVSGAVSGFALVMAAWLIATVAYHLHLNRDTAPNRKLARGEF